MGIYRIASVFVLVVTITHLHGPARAGVTFTVTQEGADVVATGSGTIDLTDLQLVGTFSLIPGLTPSFGTIADGPLPNAQVDGYSGITAIPPFGTGGDSAATSATTGSDPFGIAWTARPPC
jgi:hypothetical protein